MRLAAVIATVAFLLVIAVSCGRLRTEACSQCGRNECKNLTFTIGLESGGSVKTCCPRCALRYLAKEKPAVVSLAVRAFSDATILDARKAFYVEGSDVHPCASHDKTPAVDARGCCLKEVYDRCEPSLVAFESADKAESFARDHGGFVRTFDEMKLATH